MAVPLAPWSGKVAAGAHRLPLLEPLVRRVLRRHRGLALGLHRLVTLLVLADRRVRLLLQRALHRHGPLSVWQATTRHSMLLPHHAARRDTQATRRRASAGYARRERQARGAHRLGGLSLERGELLVERRHVGLVLRERRRALLVQPALVLRHLALRAAHQRVRQHVLQRRAFSYEV
jgi:hypothetical protein